VSSVQYSGYNFPDPLPFLVETPQPVYASGVYDHSVLDVQLVGYFTGSNLSGLHLQKQQLISGMLNEYGDLNISVSGDAKTYSNALPISIDFADSDMTTYLPYTVNFTVFSGESFSQFFGVSSPTNEWQFQEQENKIIQATHTISAQGEKVSAQDPLQNAIDFVTGLTGFQNAAPMLTGDNAFLKSRSEKINRKTSNYSITEVYHFDGSDTQETTSGIVTYDTTMSVNRQGDLSVGINGSIYGGFDGELVTTGMFTPQDATNSLIDYVAASMSEYESGAFSFVRNGPTTYNYTTNTGENKIDFSFGFVDIDNVDQVGNVAHRYNVSVQANKDNANLSIAVQGDLYFNGIDSVISTGEYENSQRFQEIESRFSDIDPYLVAYRGLMDFRSGASDFSGFNGFLNTFPKSRSVTKDPIQNKISYNHTYDTSVDYSSGLLDNLGITITNKVPLQLTKTVPTIGGFASQVVYDRTLGEYSVSASCDESENEMDTLKSIISGLTSGDFVFSSSQSEGVNNITFNLSRYY